MSDGNGAGGSPRWYWEQFVGDDGGWRSHAGHTQGPPGEDLAAMRRGAGKAPGTVPEMWRLHRAEVDDKHLRSFADTWDLPPLFVAEHHALVLYGHHQQSRDVPMHRRSNENDQVGVTRRDRYGLGTAVRALHSSGRFSEDAVNRRFYAAVTATSLEELAFHLRGLVSQLRTLSTPQPLDYSVLLRDIAGWNVPDRRDQVRRRWGRQYHSYRKEDEGQAVEGEPAA